MSLAAALMAAAPLILALLAVSAVFSAAETALTGASRGRMHQLERDGDRAAARVNRLISDQETMIGAVLIGYNVLNILSSALATMFITQVVPGVWGVAIATGVMTVLVVVFVEVLPKTLAIVRADDVARALSGPMLLVVRLLGPVIYTIQWIVRRTLGLFGVGSTWAPTCWPLTRRSAGRSSTTTPKARSKAATGRCWAACWTWASSPSAT